MTNPARNYPPPMTAEEWKAEALARAPKLSQAQKDRLRIILRPESLLNRRAS